MPEITRKRLVSDSMWSVISAAVNALFGFAYLVVVGNKWDRDGLGIFSLSVSLYMIGSLVFNLGIHNAVLYEVAAAGPDQKRASGFVYTAMFYSLLLGLFAGAAGYVFAGTIAGIFNQPSMTVLVRAFSLALPLFQLNKTMVGVLNAHRRMALIAAVDIIRDTTVMAYLIFAAILSLELSAIGYGFILSEFLIVVFLLAACLKNHRICMPSFAQAKTLINFGYKSSLSGMAGMINSRLDILMVGYFWEDAAIVGVYSVASAVTKGLWLLPGAIQRVTNPLIVQLYSSGEKEKLHRTMDVLLRHGTALFIFIGILILAFIRPLIILFYPGKPEMLDAVMPLYFLMPGVVMTAGYVMIGTAVSTSIGKPENALKIMTLVIITNFILNVLLVPFWAGVGAAAATTISYLIGFGYFNYLSKTCLAFRIPFEKFLPLLLAVCILTILSGIYEGILWRAGFVLISFVLLTAIMIIFRFVQRSDRELLLSIIRSFGKNGSLARD